MESHGAGASWVPALSSLVFCIGCSGSDPPSARADDAGPQPPSTDAAPDVRDFDPVTYRDGSEPLFEVARLLQVDVTLEPAQWETLGREGRSLAIAPCEGFEAVTGFEYTYFPAEVSVDGTALGNVGVRKKGFLGSLMISKPSLKVDMNHYEPGKEFSGLGRLTLNNNKQDGAMVRQCVTYDLFRAAGVHAPRCNFAKVTVNGTELGTYSNVESIGRRFLRRRFADPSGNLYEGQGNDFIDGRWESFQMKTNETTNDRSDLGALTEALEAPDDELLEALAPLIDVDRFLTYWAMEALTGSWDSYSTLGNNFWLYNDPDSGFEFIPWGTDATLDEAGLTGGQRTQHVSADSKLSERLYALPEVRARYFQRLRDLLDEVWDIDAILAQVDAWESLVRDANPEAVEQVRDFVRRRPEVILAELNDSTPPEPSPGDLCFDAGPSVSATFSGVWVADASAPPNPESTASLVVDGAPVDFTTATAYAAMGVSPVVSGAPGVVLSGTTADGATVGLTLSIERPLFGVGEIPLHAVSIIGFLTDPSSVAGSSGPFAFVSDGFIRLDEAGMTEGAPISGTLEGRIYNLGQ